MRTGAHFNPSVTLCIMVRNIPGFPISDRKNCLMYFLSQYLGSICGGLLVCMSISICVKYNIEHTLYRRG